MTYTKYKTTAQTVGEYRDLNPMVLAGAREVDVDHVIYEDGVAVPAEVLAVCPVRTPVTRYTIAELTDEQLKKVAGNMSTGSDGYEAGDAGDMDEVRAALREAVRDEYDVEDFLA